MQKDGFGRMRRMNLTGARLEVSGDAGDVFEASVCRGRGGR